MTAIGDVRAKVDLIPLTYSLIFRHTGAAVDYSCRLLLVSFVSSGILILACLVQGDGIGIPILHHCHPGFSLSWGSPECPLAVSDRLRQCSLQ